MTGHLGGPHFQLGDLRVPVIQAPMAGGPSTPALAAAVARAGGLGFLAAGYLTPAALEHELDRLRALLAGGLDGAVPFGVNLFVPQPVAQPDAVAAYREELLATEARGLAVDRLPEPDLSDTDHWVEKLELVHDHAVPVVSFTFGLPDPATVARLRGKGTYTIGTVTSPDEARRAVSAGVDALCIQGPEAGGHRAVFDPAVNPPTAPLTVLLHEIRAALKADGTPLPLIAAGGLATAYEVDEILSAGAAAAQLGTAFLRADEAGTHPLFRDALIDPAFPGTVVTRVFSGRWARALRNRFTEEHAATAPAAYPAVNQVTKPLRAAAAQQGRTDAMSLYAGVAHRLAKAAPAALIVDSLGGAGVGATD